MQTSKSYIKPETEIVSTINSMIMQQEQLPLSVIEKYVDDEAANDAFFDENLDDEYDPFFDE